MISNRSGSHQSEFMQALVPMVDLFAVLAIVFMIHSSEEIADAQTEVQETRVALAVYDEAEQVRRARRDSLAGQASKSLDEIRAEREKQAQELLAQVTEMLAAQESSAAAEYENILARIETDLEEELEREVTSIEEQTQAELEQARVEALARQATLDEQRDVELARAEQELQAQAELEAETLRRETQLALAQAEQDRVDALATQAATLDEQRRLEVARAEQELQAQAADLRREADQALARADQDRADALTAQAAALDEQRRNEVARAEQELQAQAADLRREADQALARAEQDQADALARAQQDQADALARADQDQADALARADQDQAAALARAEQDRQGDLAAQRTALDEERERALAAAAEELAPYIQAQEAKDQIVAELTENFGDFDNSAVEIDPETGTVKLHFQESYFALGSHELSEEMKSFLRAMIPRYAQSIYGNIDAAEQVESLNISGMASPIYQGVYIDVLDTSPETQRAREYNMALSNRRAEILYSFIFNADEMGDYAFRTRMEADMSIAALGFQKATPVGRELIGKPARCIEYDCQQEQATVLEFQVFSGR